MPTSTHRALLSAYRPHDLLWPRNRNALSSSAPLPAWASATWLAHAPLVVRREQMQDPWRIPVGLRGQTRGERAAAYLSQHGIARCVTPEMLASSNTWLRFAQGEQPAVATLALLAPALAKLNLPWGPTGSVGFALASGLPVLRQSSDLDLVIRSATRLLPHQTDALLALTKSALCRLDIQIDTGHGAFALAEWMSGAKQVLLKTNAGPYLVTDPWRTPLPLDAKRPS